MSALIRGPKTTDQGYIASTWLRSMSGIANRRAGRAGGVLGKLIDDVLDRGDTRALVRHVAGDMDAILGWVVYVEGVGVPVVHYVYVRKEHREKGIASSLLTAVGVQPETSFVYTCRGPDTRRLCTRYRGGTYLELAEFLKPASVEARP